MIATQANEALESLPRSEEAAATMGERGAVNQLVRAYSRAKRINHTGVWSKLYKELYYRYNFDAKARAKKSGKRQIDEVENAGLMSKLYAIASEILV